MPDCLEELDPPEVGAEEEFRTAGRLLLWLDEEDEDPENQPPEPPEEGAGVELGEDAGESAGKFEEFEELELELFDG